MARRCVRASWLTAHAATDGMNIGTWAIDKMIRFSLLVRGGEPIVWDFGSAAKHHQLYNPWLDYSGAHSDGANLATHAGGAAHFAGSGTVTRSSRGETGNS